jgi:hypothetical protein
MTDDSSDAGASTPRPHTEGPLISPLPPAPADAGQGFTTAEKFIGAVAGYEAPLVSGIAATAMLRSETDPVRRRQLETFRRLSLLWWALGLVVALIGIIVVLSFANSHGAGGVSGKCRGGPDTFDPMRTTYQSADGTHWTVTYPCLDGGATTMPIDRSLVPGGRN